VRSWGLSTAEEDEVRARGRQGESLRLIARRLGKRRPSVRGLCAPDRRGATAPTALRPAVSEHGRTRRDQPGHGRWPAVPTARGAARTSTFNGVAGAHGAASPPPGLRELSILLQGNRPEIVTNGLAAPSRRFGQHACKCHRDLSEGSLETRRVSSPVADHRGGTRPACAGSDTAATTRRWPSSRDGSAAACRSRSHGPMTHCPHPHCSHGWPGSWKPSSMAGWARRTSRQRGCRSGP
jgi:hypothetical protein